MSKNLLCILLLSISGIGLAQEENKYYLLEWGLPQWVQNEIYNWDQYEEYRLSDYINPYYFEADFNGDKTLDVAVGIKARESGTTGIMIIHGGSLEKYLMGAGLEYSNIYPDFDWMDIWMVKRERKQAVLTYNADGDIEGTKAIELQGDALLVIAAEASSRIIYWDGVKYISSWQSD